MRNDPIDLVDRPTYVYRMWDAEDRLLYVGATAYPLTRWGQHETKPWFDQVARIVAERHGNRSLAFQVERKAVTEERPLHTSERWTVKTTELSRRQDPYPQHERYLRASAAADLLKMSRHTLTAHADEWGIQSRVWPGTRRERRYRERDVLDVRRRIEAGEFDTGDQ